MTLPLHNQMEKLKTQILALAGQVEQCVHKAIIALEQRDRALAAQIIRDDVIINRMEVDLEEECLKILALYQPVAIDLRYIVATLKINNDLERIADLAVNIAQRALFLADRKAIQTPFDAKVIAAKVEIMLKDSIEALVGLDAHLARQVLAADDEVDALKAEIHQAVEDAILRNPDHIRCLIEMLLAVRYLERLADHATNIAEDVIYLVEGVIVRHTI